MNMSNAKRSPDIALNLLKLLTMFLIINSHSDILYPSKIRFLATGGSIGNELFFLISGYLFSAKPDIRRDIWKRFICLYIPVYIMLIITITVNGIKDTGIVSIIRTFVWPTEYWFIGAIFVYSILLYFLIARGIDDTKTFIGFCLLLSVIDLALYVFFIQDKNVWIVEDAYFGIVPYRSVYSILAYVLGYYLRRKKSMLPAISEKLVVVSAGVFFIGFYGFKLLLNRGAVPMSLQIISHPLTILSALFIFLSFVKIDMNPWLEGTKAGIVINSLSQLSLEAYLVQFLVISWISTLKTAFPADLMICFLAVIAAARILHTIDARVTGMILRRWPGSQTREDVGPKTETTEAS